MPQDTQNRPGADDGDHVEDAVTHPPDTDGDDSQGADDRKPALSREELYARLGVVDDDAVDADDADDADPQLEDEKPEETEAAPEPEDTEAPEGEAEEEAEPEEEAEDPEPAPTEANDDAKLLGRVPDSEWKQLPKVTRDRINALRAAHKKGAEKLREFEGKESLAKYAESIIQFADQNKITDRDLQAWLEVGAVVGRGGDDAVQELLAMAKGLGWKGEDAGAPKLPDWLQAKVDAFEIDAETAAEIAAKLPENQPKDPQRPKAPRLGPDDEALTKGRQVLDDKFRGAEQRFGGTTWAKLLPAVQRRMMLQKGAHPDAWGSIFDAAVDAVVAENKPKTPARVGRTGLAPTGRGGASPTDPNELKGRERLYALYSGRKR